MTTTSALSRERFALLFAVMLVAAAGNTAMQSLMPTIGRQLGVPDLWISIGFSLSAIIWVVTAPHWARRADHRGRRALMRLGLYGFIISMLICGGVLAAGLAGLIAPLTVLLFFVAGRAVYGGFGSASPPAVQAYIAARTDGNERTNALAALTSSFGLGTIAGPAIAPLFIFEPLGLSGPLIIFALIGIIVLIALATRLPDDTPKRNVHGRIIAYPTIGEMNAAADRDETSRRPKRLRWRDPRVFGWHMIGAIGGQGQAALFGVIGFHVIDRLSLPLSQAQQAIAIVLMAGAAASLLAQWGLIPRLNLDPKRLILWGCLLSALGAAVTGFSETMYGITLGFALASLGYGLFRPGFTSGASLAVSRSEQNAVAGMVTSVNGVAFIVAPSVAVALYGLSMLLPFLATGALMLILGVWVWRGFNVRRPSGRAG